MANRAKQDGTAWEAALVRQAEAHGYEAWRLAEGGTNDPGDLVIRTSDGDHYVIEAKRRAAMNAHDALAKATSKAEHADLPFAVTGVGVAWKRLVRKDGQQRRVQAGPPLMLISVEEWLNLIGR